MNPKFYLLGILIILGANLNTRAQVSYNKRVMGSLGTVPKAADFLNNASLDDVDMATGTLKVGIPLYEIKVNDISVPITLNYTATGIKVGQEAGPAGMGWELNAGGKIIRNVQGTVDVSELPKLPDEVLANPSVFNPYTTHRSLTQDIIDGKKDGAYDTYSYILPNGGGTYVKNGLTFPYDPLINIQHPGVIKTTDGLVYDFVGGDSKKITKRIYYEPNATVPTWITTINGQWARDPNPSIYSDWNLGSIISTKFKDTVSFVYEDIGQNTARLAAKTRISTAETLPLYRDIEATLPYDYYELNTKYYRITEPMISQSKTEITRHTRIQAIKFKNGQVSFEYSTNDILGRDVLLNITIYQILNGVTKVLKKYEFEYDLTNITYGHYLQEINVFDANQVKINSWSFTYEDKLPVIPNVETKAQDRWGFYNGVTSNKTLLEHPDNVLALNLKVHYPIANDSYNLNVKQIRYSRNEARELYGLNGVGTNGIYNIDFANRDFIFFQALRGTLKSIKLPTGATITYEYEPHRFSIVLYPNNTYQKQTINGGGIRISSITKDLGHDSLYRYASEGKVQKKTYTYGQGTFGSSGSSLEYNGYGNVTVPGNVLSNTSRYYSSSNPTAIFDINNIMLLSHPVNDMTQYNGSYAMYGSVTEEAVTPLTPTSFGKTVQYNNLPSYVDAPDYPWLPNGTSPTLSNFYLPAMHVNAGVKRESMAGIAGIKKYAYVDYEFKPVEEIRYTYKMFEAPQVTEYYNKLLSFYGTVTSQIFGPYPTQDSPSAILDWGEPDTRGGVAIKVFNQSHNTNGFGLMDYLTATNLVQEPNTPNFPGKYAYSLINMSDLSNCIRKESEQITRRTDDGFSSLTDIKYYYENKAHLLPTRVVTTNSQGDSVITRTKYAQDYASGISAIDFMKSNKLSLSDPIEEFSNFKKGTNEYIKNGIVNTFRLEDGAVFNDKIYKMSVNGNVTYAGPYYTSLDTALFKPQISYDNYLKGNIYKYTEANGSGNFVIWGYGNQFPIAKVSNAGIGGYSTSEEVAYSSFESADKGNWIYLGNPITDLTSPSGKRVYALANGSLSKIKPTSLPAKRYLVSYWYKEGSTINFSGGTLGAQVIKNSKAGWTLVEREVSSLSGSLVISGTGFIDELRFHPYDAHMTTYTYEPLIGLSGSIDAKGTMQYYEYDDAQRLKNIRDQEGNIVKSYRYNMGTSN
jgi:hypothetical protein